MFKKINIISGVLLTALAFSQVIQAKTFDLHSLYQQAKLSAPSILQNKANIKISEESKAQTNAVWFPTVNASANIARSRSTDFFGSDSNTRSTTAGINLSQTIYDHKNYINNEISDIGLNISKLNYKISEQELINKLTSAYFDVLMAIDGVTFAKAELVAISRQLEQAKQRYDVGIIAITEVLNAQAGYDSTQANVIKAENDYQIALEQLHEISGISVNKIAKLVDLIPLNSPHPNKIDDWIQKALTHNPSLQILKLQQQSAKKNISLQQAGHLPSMSLQASYQHTKSSSSNNDSSSLDSLFNTRNGNDSSVSLNLSLPIFQGGITSSRVRQANYQLQSIEQQKEAFIRSIRSQTTTSYLQIISSISQVKALKQAVVSNQSSLESTEAGFEAGTRTIVDVLNVQRDLYAAQRNYSAARYGYLNALIQLKLAVGTLSEDDLKLINQWLKK